MQRAKERIKHSAERAFKDTVTGYHSVNVERSQVAMSGVKYLYALYPVWLLNTTWNGKKFTFAMNGQTGKFVGDLPVDWGAYWKWFGGISAVTTVVVFLMSYLLWLI